MAESSTDHEDDLSLISKGLYRIVSDVIGPDCIIKLRRQARDVSDLLASCDTHRYTQHITSGSRSEGFDFKSSDLDLMFIDKNAVVYKKTYCVHMQHLQHSSLFLMDNDMCSPGFTLLRCLSCDRNNKTVYNSLVRKGDNMYLSSKLIRETFMSTSMSEVHGPCQSDNLYGKEGDRVFTIRCPVWPEEAISFVFRSVCEGWPSYNVMKDICNDGCLFVPINSKQLKCTGLVDLEWRMSFSLAEKKLIYSMNHCQFLCYGLTKLFLNEVLKKNIHIDDLLCSYFMKTAVFWEISEGSLDWTIETFLFKFWNIFRRLIKWVSDGYCPNFFIPENNMFYGKICGENQRRLLSVLRECYYEGYWCLLRCSSLNENLTTIIGNPQNVKMVSINEEEYVHVSNVEREKLWVVFQSGFIVPIHNMTRLITVLTNTLDINMESEVTMCAQKLRVNSVMQQFAYSLLVSKTFPHRSRNRKQYYKENTAKRILLIAGTYFCMKYFYYAKWIYLSGNYNKTIDILHFIKHRLQSRLYMYIWRPDYDIIISYRQQGMPYDKLIKYFIMTYMTVDSNTTIEELQLECLAEGEHTGSSNLNIPPLVFINFLLILCYTRTGDSHRRYDVLEELRMLLYNDDGYHINTALRAISWEILGICQQICGEREAAFQSYINASADEFNYFKKATIIRILSMYY